MSNKNNYQDSIKEAPSKSFSTLTSITAICGEAALDIETEDIIEDIVNGSVNISPDFLFSQGLLMGASS